MDGIKHFFFALFSSMRFRTAATTIVAIVANEVFSLGISEDAISAVVAIVIGWIVGDSLRKTVPLMEKTE